MRDAPPLLKIPGTNTVATPTAANRLRALIVLAFGGTLSAAGIEHVRDEMLLIANEIEARELRPRRKRS